MSQELGVFIKSGWENGARWESKDWSSTYADYTRGQLSTLYRNLSEVIANKSINPDDLLIADYISSHTGRNFEGALFDMMAIKVSRLHWIEKELVKLI